MKNNPLDYFTAPPNLEALRVLRPLGPLGLGAICLLPPSRQPCGRSILSTKTCILYGARQETAKVVWLLSAKVCLVRHMDHSSVTKHELCFVLSISFF